MILVMRNLLNNTNPEENKVQYYFVSTTVTYCVTQLYILFNYFNSYMLLNISCF